MCPIEGKQPARLPPQYWEVWRRIKERLVGGNFTNLLLGAGRVYGVGEQIKAAEDSLMKPWGRLVITPVTAAYNVIEELGRDALLPFLIRTDYYRPDDSNFDHERWHDAAQLEVFRRLHGFGPITDMQHARVDHPIYRQTGPQAVSMWDSERGVYIKSSTYHVYVSPPPLGV